MLTIPVEEFEALKKENEQLKLRVQTMTKSYTSASQLYCGLKEPLVEDHGLPQIDDKDIPPMPKCKEPKLGALYEAENKDCDYWKLQALTYKEAIRDANKGIRRLRKKLEKAGKIDIDYMVRVNDNIRELHLLRRIYNNLKYYDIPEGKPTDQSIKKYEQFKKGDIGETE